MNLKFPTFTLSQQILYGVFHSKFSRVAIRIGSVAWKLWLDNCHFCTTLQRYSEHIYMKKLRSLKIDTWRSVVRQQWSSLFKNLGLVLKEECLFPKYIVITLGIDKKLSLTKILFIFFNEGSYVDYHNCIRLCVNDKYTFHQRMNI